MANDLTQEHSGHKFGTFSGVFTPSILTIFGLIMFMRTSYVVGHAGIYAALGILFVSKLITFATGISIAAVSTNTPVKGGGAYFLISRALGPGFGSSIGLALFSAQVLSVPFYIFGFSEALIKNFSLDPSWYMWVALSAGVILFAVACVGTDWVMKCQSVILVILGIAISAFFIGAIIKFNGETFAANWHPYKESELSMTTVFAIFFPAVTGIMAGVNMSGDLKNPARSIPRGSLFAIMFSFVVYAGQMLITGGAFSRESLISTPYMVLVTHAVFGAGFLVALGVYAATLSSALGSLIGSPRVMQALAIDRIIGGLSFFAKGEGDHNEPRRALFLTGIISFAVLVWGGMAGMGEGGFLNMVAEIVTMFFLYTYGIVNLAAFVESYGANPSFRPRFKFYHWSIALLGAVGCIVTSFLINLWASCLALAIITALFFIARRNEMECTFGDARRGFFYSRVRGGLLTLRKMMSDPKNWRPTIVVFTRDASRGESLLRFASLFECKRGILTVVTFIQGKFDDLRDKRKTEIEKIEHVAENLKMNFFPEVIVTPEFETGVQVFLQSHSIGPVKPNIVMSGWPEELDDVHPFMNHLRTISRLDMSIVLLVGGDKFVFETAHDGRIDLWWRGHANGSLMLILAYLLRHNAAWNRVKIRILRMVTTEEEYDSAHEELVDLIENSRIDAEPKVVVSTGSFDKVLNEQSSDSLAVFLGFLPPSEDFDVEFYKRANQYHETMPTLFYVASSGQADLLA